jgi:hypothetical protein
MQLSNDELLSRMQCMEQRIRVLEGQLNSQAAAPKAGTDAGAENPWSKTTEQPRPFPMRIVRVPGNDAKAKTPANKEEAETAPRATPPAVASEGLAAADPCAPQPNAPSSTRVARSPSPKRCARARTAATAAAAAAGRANGVYARAGGQSRRHISGVE